MSNIPCPSDFRSGDELNPSSPYYEEPAVQEGSERVELSWIFYFDPAHPEHGDESKAIVKGDLLFSDIYEPLSSSDKRALRHGADIDQKSDRAYEDFVVVGAEFPNGKKVSLAELVALPGFGPAKDQIDDLKGELIEAATDALKAPLKHKVELERLRSEWKVEAEPAPAKPKAF